MNGDAKGVWLMVACATNLCYGKPSEICCNHKNHTANSKLLWSYPVSQIYMNTYVNEFYNDVNSRSALSQHRKFDQNCNYFLLKVCQSYIPYRGKR